MILELISDTIVLCGDAFNNKNLLLAYKTNKDILIIDENCSYQEYENLEQLINVHKFYLSQRTKWQNPYKVLHARGLPFTNIGNRADIVINHGLTLQNIDTSPFWKIGNLENNEKIDTQDNKVVSSGVYFPFSLKNIFVKSEFVPFMYQMKSNPYSDVWCGIIMKKILDISGHTMSYGAPWLINNKEENLIKQIEIQTPYLQANELFWKYVDEFKSPIKENDPLSLYYLIGMHLCKYDDYDENEDVSKLFIDYGNEICNWCSVVCGGE